MSLRKVFEKLKIGQGAASTTTSIIGNNSTANTSANGLQQNLDSEDSSLVETSSDDEASPTYKRR